MTVTSEENQLNKPQYQPNKVSFIGLGVIVLIVVITVVLFWKSQIQLRKPKSVRDEKLFITTQKKQLSTNQVQLSTGGFVTAKHSGHITGQVSGKIIAISPSFAVGESIKKGQILVNIDPSDYKVAVITAEAHLATAKSTYTQELAKARQAARDAQRLNVKSNDLLLRKPQIIAAKAAINNAEAQLEQAKKNLKKTQVEAPFDAIVTQRNVTIGDSVVTNTIIGELVNLEAFTVKLTLDSHNYHLVSIGNDVILNNPVTGIIYRAKINRLDPALDKTTRTVGIYVDIEKPRQSKFPLLLNSYLHATILGRDIANSQWIDNRSIIDNQFLWSVDNRNRLIKTPIILVYRDKYRSLVRFQQKINYFISHPKDNFFEDKKVKINQGNQTMIKNTLEQQESQHE